MNISFLKFTRKWRLITSLVLFFGVSFNGAASTIGYWRFESDTTLLQDSGGFAGGPFNATSNLGSNNANDAYALPTTGAGSSFPRTIVKTGSANAGAALFSAAETTPDAFTVPHNAVFNSSEFTIEAIVNMASEPGIDQSRTIASRFGSVFSARHFRLAIDGRRSDDPTAVSGTVVLTVAGVADGANWTTRYIFNASEALTTGKDYYVAASFRVTSTGRAVLAAHIKNLTDNQPLQTRSFNSSRIYSSVNTVTSPFAIGAAISVPLGEIAWDGVIDEVRYSNTALDRADLLIVPPPPVITVQPVSQTIATNELAVFSVEATSMVAPRYQWLYNGAPLSGATTSRFLLLRAPALGGFVGNYSCEVSNDGGTVTSNVGTLAIVSSSDPGKLSALSIRGQVGTVNDVMVAGIIVEGGNVQTLIQAVGPTLGVLFPSLAGVVLADPKMELYELVGDTFVKIQENNDWGGSAQITTAEQATAATLLSAAKDSALLTTLAPGVYTANVSGINNTTGVVLLQAYAVPAANSGVLSALSIRGQVGTGSDNMVAGIIVGGTTSKTLIIQAVGPTLGVLHPSLQSVVLANPKLELYQLVNDVFVKIRENDDWGGDAQIIAIENATGSTPLSNPASKDCALLVTLAPGVYTANVSGVGTRAG